MTDHVFFEDNATQNVWFLICLFKLPSSPYGIKITATMLFLQFLYCSYPSSFVGTPKNEIPGAALELCQLKIKQFSPDILKFSTKRE